jgi:hypothetical protein
MIELQYGNLKASVPGSWHELNAKQLAKAVDILSQEKNRVDGQLAFIYYLLPIKYKKLMDSFTGLELVTLIGQFEFLTFPPSFQNFLFTKLKRNWFSLSSYQGPTNSFENLSVREYGTAEFYLGQYSHLVGVDDAKADECLNKFLGSIYFKYNRQPAMSRAKYDIHLKKTALLLSSIPLKQKQAIAFNFTAVRDFVFAQFDEAFSKSEVKSKRAKYGWDGVVQHIAATRHMVSDCIYNMNLLEFLIQLDTIAIAENERETK